MKTITSSLAIACLLTTFSFGQIEQKIQLELNQKADEFGLTKSDVQDWIITDQHDSKQFDITYAYIQQEYNDVPVFNAVANFAINDVLTVMIGNDFIADLPQKVNATSASISRVDAIRFAASHLQLTTESDFEIIATDEEKFFAPLIADNEIPVSLVYTVNGDQVKLAWNLNLDVKGQDHWWNVRIDALTGELINKNDWTVSCTFEHDHAAEQCGPVVTPQTNSQAMMPAPPPGTDQYNVFELPLESPNHGARTIAVGPSDPVSSPFGWHDDNGVAGEEYTITRGNNVHAYEDTDDNNQPGYSPDGGAALDFDFPLNFNQPATGWWDAAITNLFYMNNMIHDFWYHYGFDEASGNFQEDNYNNGGAASDYVRAEAQDGSGTNNANFSTPDDGSNPRMQMYLWGNGGPDLSMQVNSPVGLAGIYNSTPGNIGAPLPAPGSPVTADLVLFEDATGDIYDACEAPVNGASINGKIAVIRRGTCTYVDKIVAAENEGAVAVIMVNNVGGAPVVMGGTDPGIGIPAIMIGMTDGENLITELINGTTINASISDYGPFPHDSDFDNGIIAHEYGHGISNRLVGGGSNTNCLFNDEQMGEGWSDWFAMIMTIEPGDQGTDARGMGTYASDEPVNGGGIRNAPYSTDWTVNNYTYASTNASQSVSQPHGIGFIWCTMLWDLTWKLIDTYGYDSDLINGTGGNNIAMHLIMEGMKMTPCTPGFVEARDAILNADFMLYNNANQCIIWEVFANRGLGFSADQGSAGNREDQTAAFDLPPALDHTTTATSCLSYTWALNGQTYTTSGTYYEPIVPTNGCDSVATLNLTITQGLNPFVSYADAITLQTNTVADTYQWITCSDDQPVAGATSSTFTAPANGIYAVIVEQNTCVDTSVCMLINQVGLDDFDPASAVNVFPNPTKGSLTVELGSDDYQSIQIFLTNSIGQIIEQYDYSNISSAELKLNGAPGIYFVEIKADDRLHTRVKVIKE